MLQYFIHDQIYSHSLRDSLSWPTYLYLSSNTHNYAEQHLVIRL